MRSFNGNFPPWRCNGRQRRKGERRRHPLGNKPWKKELHHQDEPWIRSLERMLQWRKRKRERKRPPRMERVTKIRALREKGDRWITMCGKLILIWDTICMGGR